MDRAPRGSSRAEGRARRRPQANEANSSDQGPGVRNLSGNFFDVAALPRTISQGLATADGSELRRLSRRSCHPSDNSLLIQSPARFDTGPSIGLRGSVSHSLICLSRPSYEFEFCRRGQVIQLLTAAPRCRRPFPAGESSRRDLANLSSLDTSAPGTFVCPSAVLVCPIHGLNQMQSSLKVLDTMSWRFAGLKRAL